ncbi:MAG: DNA cytosine methyltransferase, partial [Halothiobacillaceae bacterium]
DAARLKDPRAITLVEFMRCVGDVLPRAFLLENVHGISYSGKEEGLLLIEQLTRDINRREGVSYTLSWRVLNAADYGVPQARVRFFLVGHREGKQFNFPRPTHGLVEAESPGMLLPRSETRPYVTAWDAISSCRPPRDEDLRVRGRWAELLPSIPEGQNYLWHTNRGGGLPLFGWRTRYWSFLLKLAKDRPSWTIQAQPGPAIGPFHWENRRLSIEEMARLQTFPKDLKYCGSRASVQRQLGNAVPSLMAEILAREIRRQLLAAPVDGPPKLEVTLNRPIPPAEPVKPVPDKFLRLQGEHPDHPGEGKGDRAVRVRTAQGDASMEATLWDSKA